MDFSFSAFHRSQQALRLIADDGDGVPSPKDRFVEIWTGKEVEGSEVEPDLETFYRRQFYHLTEKIRKDIGEAYPLGTRIAYAEPEVQRRFVAYMATRPFPAAGWVALERSAKARGNVELGRALGRALQQRPVWKQGYRLGFRDAWGDPFYLEPGNSSVQILFPTGPEGLNLNERRELAEILSLFISVKVEPQVEVRELLRIGRLARDFYRQGLPLPPRLRLFQPVHSGPNQTPGGSYQAKTDTLSLPADAGADAWAHEWSHFLLDILDDQNGLNSTFFEPKDSSGGFIFDPNRCSTWESLSIYAGTCDPERGGTVMAGSKKAAEDPAETLASVLEARRGDALPSTLHMNLIEIYFLERLRSVQYFTEGDEVEKKDLDDLFMVAKDFHRHLGGDFPAPPKPGNKTELSTDLAALAHWVRYVEGEFLPQAKARRRVKTHWAEGLLRALVPDPTRNFPDPLSYNHQLLDFLNR